MQTHTRIIDDNYNNHEDKGCKYLPIWKLDPGNIIPDELHLLLRITDVLTENLISTSKADDRIHNKHLKLTEGPMVKAMIENIRSCHISFDIWETYGVFECTPLMVTDKKTLLESFPPKLIHCQPATFAPKVKNFGEVC